jgi:hypothetical protein
MAVKKRVGRAVKTAETKPSDKGATIKSRMPVGFILILVYLFLGVVSMLFSFFSLFGGVQGSMQFGPAMISSNAIIFIYYIIVIAVEASLIYGIFKRKKYTRILGIVWFGLMLLLMIFNMIFISQSISYVMEQYPGSYPDGGELAKAVIYKISMVIMMLSLVLHALIFWYFIKKKSFFNS